MWLVVRRHRLPPVVLNAPEAGDVVPTFTQDYLPYVSATIALLTLFTFYYTCCYGIGARSFYNKVILVNYVRIQAMWPFSTAESRTKSAMKILVSAKDEDGFYCAKVVIKDSMYQTFPLLHHGNFISCIVDKCFYFWETKHEAVPTPLRDIISSMPQTFQVDFKTTFLQTLQRKWMLRLHEDCTSFSALFVDDALPKLLDRLPHFIINRSMYFSSVPSVLWSRILEQYPADAFDIILGIILSVGFVSLSQEISHEFLKLLFTVKLVSIALPSLEKMSDAVIKLKLQFTFDQYVDFIYLNHELTSVPSISNKNHWVVLELIRSSIRLEHVNGANSSDCINLSTTIGYPPLQVENVLSRLIQRLSACTATENEQLYIAKSIVFIWTNGGRSDTRIPERLRVAFTPQQDKFDFNDYARFVHDVKWSN